MAKVRMGQQCAGGCGTYLWPGSQGFRMHKNWWCFSCALTHRSTCTAHEAPVPAGV